MAEMNETQNVQENTPDSKSSEKKGKKKGIIALLLLLLAAAAVGGWWYYTSRPVMDNTTKYWFDKFAEDGSLEGKSPVEIQGILNNIVEEGMFNVSINARAIFPDGKSKGSIGMENVPQNRYYARIIMTKDDDGTVLYESQGIKPGQYIDQISLSTELDAGEYPCTVLFIITDPETLDDIGQVRVNINVVILN